MVDSTHNAENQNKKVFVNIKIEIQSEVKINRVLISLATKLINYFTLIKKNRIVCRWL